MLTIRQAQMDVFRNQARLDFESEMAGYLKRYFPFEAANSDLDRWVQTGLDRASRLGFLTQRECAMYLALMAMLGASFEEDPLVPWAMEILSQADEPSLDRISRLYEKGIEYLESTSGPKGVWFDRAKRRMPRQDTSVLDRGVHARALSGRISALLAESHPEKARVAGDKALKILAKSAIERAEQRGATTPRAALIQALHTFHLGSGFDEDPCFPWAGAALEGVAVKSPNESMDARYDRLQLETVDYFKRSLKFEGKRA